MIVKNKSKRCIRVSKTVLKPGSNMLNDKQVEDFNKSLEFAERLIDNGVLELPEVSKVHEKPEKASKETAQEITSVSELNAKDAISLIEDTFDKEALETFYNEESERDEPRVTVVRAIEKQIAKMEDAQEENKDETNEEE